MKSDITEHSTAWCGILIDLQIQILVNLNFPLVIIHIYIPLSFPRTAISNFEFKIYDTVAEIYHNEMTTLGACQKLGTKKMESEVQCLQVCVISRQFHGGSNC